MRLIDADALLAKLKRTNRYFSVKFDIEEAPTIDPEELRKKGRWVITKEYNDVLDMDVAKYTCSACQEYRLSASGLSQATNYCPNCGAKMEQFDN